LLNEELISSSKVQAIQISWQTANLFSRFFRHSYHAHFRLIQYRVGCFASSVWQV